MMDGGKYHDTHLKEWSLSLTEWPILGCSIFAVSKKFTTNRKTIFGRNYDWDKWVADYSIFWKSYPDNALASISGTDLFVGRYGGLNESGLAIAVAAIRGFKGDVPGVALHYIVRQILDNCTNVAEAATFLRRIPHFRANNYLLCDSNDNIAYVEATPKQVILKDETKKGFAVITNHFRSPETMVYENEENISSTSKPRFNLINDWFSSQPDKLSESQIQSILCNTLDTKAGVCEDRSNIFRNEKIPYGTIWSWTATPGDRWIQLSHPTYERVNFQKYEF
ncbi:MAG: C45 family autoproteolytic acyltransferase/hydrolase [Candidatus Hodarchaeales archaeon]